MSAAELRRLYREAGFALAILALWMLALLGPLHQLSRTAADLNLSGWSFCLIADPQEDQHGPPPAFCPAQSIAKALTAPPHFTGLRRAPPPESVASTPVSVYPASRLKRREIRQPRAPPSRA